MRKKFAIPIVILSLLLIHGCKKEEKPEVPVITTTEVTEISYTTATSGGDVTSEGGNPVTSRGVCWNTAVNPTISNSKTTATGSTGSFSTNLTGLTPNTLYYVRAYATNNVGTAYGDQVSFTTMQSTPPVLTATTAVTQISYTTATSGGNVTSEGGNPVTSRGVCWNTAANPTITDSKTTETGGAGSFSTNLTGLAPNTLYYVRAYATNGSGTAYGDQVSFTTMQALPPVITTASVTSYTATTAEAGGNVTAENGAAVTVRGVCWSTNPDPTTSDSKTSNGTGPGTFTSTLTGLTPSTTYYLRAYAINSEGTSYGEGISFKTFTAVDMDGHGYNSVTIGTQTWLVENLKTTKYQNGDIIATTSTMDISGESNPKYQWAYEGNESNVDKLGRLYTWYVVTDSRGICPTGWHIPSEAEQMELTSYLGGANYAGGKLKESGTTNWSSPNTSADNSSGFTALPGGLRYSWGTYLSKGTLGFFWSTSDWSATQGKDLYLQYDTSLANHGSWDKSFGFSVRCIKD